ncbi:MAG: hypothetical protein J6I76_07640 [Oribacterium sp.]|nr:hypothetical protein [Oribacterium sp.]
MFFNNLFKKSETKTENIDTRNCENCYILEGHEQSVYYANESLFDSYPFFKETAKAIVSICADRLDVKYRVYYEYNKSHSCDCIIRPNQDSLGNLPNNIQNVVDRLLIHDFVIKLANKISELFINGSSDYNYYRFYKKERGFLINIGKSRLSYSDKVMLFPSKITNKYITDYEDNSGFEIVNYNDYGMAYFNDYQTLLGFAIALTIKILAKNDAFKERNIDLRSIFQACSVKYGDYGYTSPNQYQYGISILFASHPKMAIDNNISSSSLDQKQSTFRQW